jgi:hypothetical protein
MDVVAWGHQVEGNAGYDKDFVKLTEGNGPKGPIILRKKGSGAKPKAKP